MAALTEVRVVLPRTVAPTTPPKIIAAATTAPKMRTRVLFIAPSFQTQPHSRLGIPCEYWTGQIWIADRVHDAHTARRHGWSGRWESNPRKQLGRLPHYHCATPALCIWLVARRGFEPLISGLKGRRPS